MTDLGLSIIPIYENIESMVLQKCQFALLSNLVWLNLVNEVQFFIVKCMVSLKLFLI